MPDHHKGARRSPRTLTRLLPPLPPALLFALLFFFFLFFLFFLLLPLLHGSRESVPLLPELTEADRNLFFPAADRFDQEYARLHKERATTDGDIVLTFANLAFCDMHLNLVRQLHAVGLGAHYITVALDRQAARFLHAQGVCVIFPFEHSGSNFSLGDSRYATPDYNHLVNQKVLFTLKTVELGYNALVIDTDSGVSRNPLEYIHLHIPPDFDLLVEMEDLPSNCGDPFFWNSTVHETPLPCDEFISSAGFYYVRATPAGVRFEQKLWTRVSYNETYFEQVSMNIILINTSGFRVRFFDPFLFACGKAYFRDPKFEEKYGRPVSVHANWMTGHDIKRGALVSRDWWVVPSREQKRIDEMLKMLLKRRSS
eukprot:CAMPEP_0177636412 /NCGR_PEP_ID=MMETSP0447-20121125/4425_1 /TAXON_ID=0 /ORGANISM="Stygamoeba regulata, Strain BSH-02190019" /LENGTH=368 /DNA_ID=CAMNT_0019138273 /DNA_START=56 /DNA_END=1162 /DNA_ORIENTATION=-